MHLPSALPARETILGLYRNRAERVHAFLHFILSGVEQQERVFAVLDDATLALARSVVEYATDRAPPKRFRSMRAEVFEERGPMDADRAVELVVSEAKRWLGRPSARPMRVVVDLHYVLSVLSSRHEVPEIAERISTLVARYRVICLCLLYAKHLPAGRLDTFLESFSRILVAEPLLATDGHGATSSGGEEIDAVLDRLLLSDEAVLERSAAEAHHGFEELDVRAFPNIVADGILVLDRDLVCRYVSPSLRLRFDGSSRVSRGTALSELLPSQTYEHAAWAFERLAADTLAEGEAVARLIPLSFVHCDGTMLQFEASVSPLAAYGRVHGFVCVLRRITEDGEEPQRVNGPKTPEPPRLRWRQLPRQFVEARSLTGREAEVLELTMNEWSTADIAQRLGIALTTVKTHRTHGYRKLGVRGRFGLLRFAETEQ